MPSLFTIAALLTMISLAFPPLILPAAICWFFLIRTVRRRVKAQRDLAQAKVDRAAQARYDKALRFFQ